MARTSSIGKVMEILNRPVTEFEELTAGPWQIYLEETFPRSWNLLYGNRTVLLHTLNQDCDYMPAYSWIIFTEIPAQVNAVMKRMNIPIQLRRTAAEKIKVTAPLRTFTVLDSYYTLYELLSGEIIGGS